MLPKLIAISFVTTVSLLFNPVSSRADDGRQACESDAFRLCGHAIPNRERVKACLIANKRQLSPACRQRLASSS